MEQWQWRYPISGSWLMAASLLSLLLLTVDLAHAVDPLSSGMNILRREKSVGEEYARLLKDYAESDASKLAQGRRLYALAKAGFDGIIEQLDDQLDRPQPPDASAEFEKKLQAAVDQRVVFTSYVDGLLPPPQPGEKGPLGDIIKGAGELVSALTDASIKIWREFRAASSENRKDVRERLKGLKWRSFAEATGS